MNTRQRICVINLIFLVVTTLGVSEESSKLIYDFIAVANGDYDNRAQVKVEPDHDFIQCRVVPVSTPALPGLPALYGEWSSNGRVILMNLMAVREFNGDVLLDLYNFTDINLYKPLTFNVSDVSTVKPETLRNRSVADCKAGFEPEGVGSFVGSFDECRHVLKGHHDAYRELFTCNKMLTMIPLVAIETSTLIPYHTDRISDKYPLIGAPDGYVDPCK